MAARRYELQHLSSNIKAIQTIANSSVLNHILDMIGVEHKYRTITIQEFMCLNEAFLKMDNAITEFNNLVHTMNGTQSEPEPHGARDPIGPSDMYPECPACGNSLPLDADCRCSGCGNG